MLTFIGVGSAFNTERGNTSAWMRLGDRFLLVDCGGMVFHQLLQQRLLEKITALNICLTHTHGDHVGSLGDLVLYCRYMLKIRPTVHHPDGERIRTLLTLFGVSEDDYCLEDARDFSLDSGLQIGFIPQSHTETMPAYGLLLSRPDMKVWYSGDSKAVPSAILSAFLAGEIDLFYQDTSGADTPEALHMSLNRLKELIPPPLRHRVLCMHQDEAFDPQAAMCLGFRVAEIGRDSASVSK